MHEVNPNDQNKTKQVSKLKSVQLGLVLMLALFLLIPLGYVQKLTYERQERQNTVKNEISSIWGEKVLFYGPILKVPFIKEYKKKKKNELGEAYYEIDQQTHYAYILPEDYNVKGTVDASKKHRGLYDAVVFKSDFSLEGEFNLENYKDFNVPRNQFKWDKAQIILKTSNLKSMTENVQVRLDDNTYDFQPYYNDESYYIQSLTTKEFGLKDSVNQQNNIRFDIKLSYNGSESVEMVPIGKTSSFEISSNWKDPSFNGNYLPIDKVITEKGFSANWKILHYNRPFSQTFASALPNLSKYGFGLEFMVSVDQYQQNERTAKYGILVIGLTFLTFFMIQVINKLSIHIIEYVFIGIAMVLFYTLLLSITEHSTFSIAYLVSSTATIALISIYSFSLLKKVKLLFFIMATMSLLYAYIFVIIQMESYALLSGSIGLFVILSIVMYFSRKIEWSK
jgi:inner membrane protein